MIFGTCCLWTAASAFTIFHAQNHEIVFAIISQTFACALVSVPVLFCFALNKRSILGTVF